MWSGYNYLHIYSVPSRPRIDSVQVTNNSITVTWSQATGDRIENYIIEHIYRDTCSYSSHNNISNHTNNQTTVRLGDLEEFSNYQVNITAVNSQGVNSLVTNISTLSSGKHLPAVIDACMIIKITCCIMYTAPSGEPQNVNGTTINSTSIQIEWSDVDCIKRNGNISAYSVTYRAVGYPQPSLSLIALHTDRSLLLNNLVPHTNYSLLVAAQNINGTGPSREEVVKTSAVEGKFKFIITIQAL